MHSGYKSGVPFKKLAPPSLVESLEERCNLPPPLNHPASAANDFSVGYAWP